MTLTRHPVRIIGGTIAVKSGKSCDCFIHVIEYKQTYSRALNVFVDISQAQISSLEELQETETISAACGRASKK